MKKKSQLERAIESLEAERAVLDAAINRMKQELAKKPAAVKRTKAAGAAPLELAKQG